MAKRIASPQNMQCVANEMLQISNELSACGKRLQLMAYASRFCSNSVTKGAKDAKQRIDTSSKKVKAMADSLQNISQKYEKADNDVITLYTGDIGAWAEIVTNVGLGATLGNNMGGFLGGSPAMITYDPNALNKRGIMTKIVTSVAGGICPNPTWWDTFKEEFGKNYGWDNVLKDSGGYISQVYGLYQEAKKADSIKEVTNVGRKTTKFIKGIVKTYKNYERIGNAVGQKKATTWWIKSILNLKPVGYASKAKKLKTNFWNNLTNKHSPFNLKNKISEELGDFTGANGVKTAVASWADVLVSGVTNWFSNKEEQKNSNGTMSDERVIAETVTETVLEVTTDMVVRSVVTPVVGAALTTFATVVLGATSVPTIAVVVGTGIVVAAGKTLLDSGFKHFTGKTATEWASDFIVDSAEYVGEKVGQAVKVVSEKVKEVADTGKKVIGEAVETGKKIIGEAVDKGKQIVSGAWEKFKRTVSSPNCGWLSQLAT